MKESPQEWLCDNRNEITRCIGIALQNHKWSYAEWFKYVDDRSDPDELAIYGLSRQRGVHTAIFNKSYVWTTLADHVLRSDEEILGLCGVNLVFLDYTTYGIIKNIRTPNPTDTKKTPSPTPLTKSRAKLHVMIAQENQWNKPDQNSTPNMARDREPWVNQDKRLLAYLHW